MAIAFECLRAPTEFNNTPWPRRLCNTPLQLFSVTYELEPQPIAMPSLLDQNSLTPLSRCSSGAFIARDFMLLWTSLMARNKTVQVEKGTTVDSSTLDYRSSLFVRISICRQSYSVFVIIQWEGARLSNKWNTKVALSARYVPGNFCQLTRKNSDKRTQTQYDLTILSLSRWT